ncbi:unnamed protein product [Spirodela intermedia]|uniref:GATA-type domain-containing protein n=1 Tax=Spirodela intermedia TaxID=51605 RepID=A0A7I8J8U5_SPIIN|nr:unnamed protein product [Spirodela intermedia]CAA6666504.1 unnamed protein product [Spirodela intermedia]
MGSPWPLPGGGAGEPSRTRRKRKRGSPLRNGENTGAAVGCAECGASQSPMWRRGPAGPKTLCNACGIRYAKAKRRRTHLEELLLKLREEILTPAVLSVEEEVYAALTLMAISSEHFLNASQQR